MPGSSRTLNLEDPSLLSVSGWRTRAHARPSRRLGQDVGTGTSLPLRGSVHSPRKTTGTHLRWPAASIPQPPTPSHPRLFFLAFFRGVATPLATGATPPGDGNLRFPQRAPLPPTAFSKADFFPQARSAALPGFGSHREGGRQITRMFWWCGRGLRHRVRPCHVVLSHLGPVFHRQDRDAAAIREKVRAIRA